MTRALAWVALATGLLTATPIAGQESVFNLPGFGLPAAGESMRVRSLGGTIGLAGEVFSVDNPASMAGFRRAGFSLSLYGHRATITDDRLDADVEDVAFPMGQVVFPARSGWTFGVGFQQFLDFDVGLESVVEFEGDSLPATLDVEGGVSLFAPAVAYALDARTSLAASLDVYVGSRETVRSIRTADQDGNTTTTSDTLARDFRSLGLTVGIMRDLGRARLAAAYRLRPELSSEITRSVGGGLVGEEREVGLPDEIIVGLSAPLSRRVGMGANLRYSGWGGVDPGDPTSGPLADALEIGGGLEFTPGAPTAWILGPVAPLRVGGRWRRLPVEIDGQSVVEWAGTLGYGRELGARARVDLLLELGRRGTVEDHGVAERFVRFGMDVSLFEQWRRDAPEGSGSN